MLRVLQKGLAEMLSPGCYVNSGAWGMLAWIDPVIRDANPGTRHCLLVLLTYEMAFGVVVFPRQGLKTTDEPE